MRTVYPLGRSVQETAVSVHLQASRRSDGEPRRAQPFKRRCFASALQEIGAAPDAARHLDVFQSPSRWLIVSRFEETPTLALSSWPEARDAMAVVGFDVYGTLVDPLAMEVPLRAHVGERAPQFAAQWRQHQLDTAFRRALMRRYVNFDVVTRDALRFTARQLEVTLSEVAEEALLSAYVQLPAFADAQSGLLALGAEGHRLLAFSNGLESTLRRLLAHVRLLPPLAGVVSVDDVRTYKPDPAVYLHLAHRGGAPIEQTWLVSSNAWDVLGAKAAGLRAAWLRRHPTAQWEGLGIGEPDLVVSSLGELTGKLP
jgi:2-haloacid dehalogenase